MLCCLLCLTVCAVPALAGLNQTIAYVNGGFFYPSAISPFHFLDSSGNEVSIFNGNLSATFTNDEFNSPHWDFSSELISGPFSAYVTVQDSFIEILFNVTEPCNLSVTTSNQGSLQVGHSIPALNRKALFGSYLNSVQFICDSNYYPCTLTNSSLFNVPVGEYRVARYFGYRFVFDYHRYSFVTNENATFLMRLYDNSVFALTDWPNGEIVGAIDINTGVLQEINGNVSEIKTQLTKLNQDVSEIKDGLQDSNSTIWGAFKESVSGLFVPSAGELESVKNGFDQLAQDKLGGAYQTVELVDNGVQSVVNKFKNPGSSPGVEFPGISVPLGGDVGTVTLAASQTVTIPEKITDVLYPVSGVIIPIVCVIWTIRQCTDMVECFMSGMSYAEFLHRNSDKEDEEV